MPPENERHTDGDLETRGELAEPHGDTPSVRRSGKHSGASRPRGKVGSGSNSTAPTSRKHAGGTSGPEERHGVRSATGRPVRGSDLASRPAGSGVGRGTSHGGGKGQRCETRKASSTPRTAQQRPRGTDGSEPRFAGPNR